MGRFHEKAKNGAEVLYINMNRFCNLFSRIFAIFMPMHCSNVCFQSALKRMRKVDLLRGWKLFYQIQIFPHLHSQIFPMQRIMKCLRDLSSLKDFSEIVISVFFEAIWFNMLFRAFTQIWLIWFHPFTCTTLNRGIINVVFPPTKHKRRRQLVRSGDFVHKWMLRTLERSN